MFDVNQALDRLREEDPELANLLQAILDEAKAHAPVLSPPPIPDLTVPPPHPSSPWWTPYTLTLTCAPSSSSSLPFSSEE